MTTTPPPPTDRKLWNLYSLQRYWFYAERMKRLLFKELQSGSLSPLSQVELSELLLRDYAIYMSYWLSGLNVVIEGYRNLSISDAKIDQLLLDDDRRAALQRFRNAIFHYQPKYFTPKLFEFFGNDSLNWARSLHDRLGTVLTAQIAAATAAPDEA